MVVVLRCDRRADQRNRKAGQSSVQNRAPFRIARICERYQITAAGGIGRACFPVVHGRYKRWEVGGGRATRQPGQIRKEAALTSAVRVARQPPTHCFAVPRLRRHFGANAAELAGCSLNGKTGQQPGGSCTASRLCCRPASLYALAPAAQDRRAALSPRRVFRVRIARP